MAETIGDVMAAEGEEETDLVISMVHADVHAGEIPSHAVGIHIVARTSYQLGLEVGARIAVADVASARRLIEYFSRVVHGGDQEAITGANRRAGRYLAVLDRDGR